MTLTQIFLLLGATHALVGRWFGWAPDKAGGWLKRFPRQVPPGVFLMLLGTGWFVTNLYRSDVTDFKEWQHLLLAGPEGVAGFRAEEYFRVSGLRRTSGFYG